MIAEENWTVQKIINWTTGHFNTRKIESSRLDAEVLLASTLNCSRMDLYLRFDQPLKEVELSHYKELVKRRAKYEPVAYILGEKEFYGRDFLVGQGVLVPRPETEHLIDETLKWAKKHSDQQLEILDVGTGSGCIAVTLAIEIPNAKVLAIDNSEVAVKFARANSEKWNATNRVTFEVYDFVDQPLSGSHFDVVVANPPYVARKTENSLAPDVAAYEPASALYGGEQGFEILDKWIPKMIHLLKPNGFLACEIGYDQRDIVSKILDATGLCQEIRFAHDYSGHARVAIAIKSG